MNINELNNAWIESGQKVADLNMQINTALIDDNYDEEKFANLKAQRDKEVTRRDNLKEQLDTARAEEVYNMPDKDKKPLSDSEKNLKDKFVENFVGMMNGNSKIVDMVTSSVDDNGDKAGLTIPSDVQTAIWSPVNKIDNLNRDFFVLCHD